VRETFIEIGASLGANCTILPGLRIGRYAMIGAGSVVTGNVPPFAIVMGNPARITGYVDSHGATMPPAQSEEPPPIGDAAVVIPGVTRHQLLRVDDVRGTLSVAEIGADVPFEVRRFLAIYDVPSKDTRGERAHRSCEQFLVCIRGSVSLVVDDGRRRTEVVLNQSNVGIHIRSMIWTVLYRHTADAIMLVFASEHYDPADYIRDYDEFLRLSSQMPAR
jgi:hypothetical protein